MKRTLASILVSVIVDVVCILGIGACVGAGLTSIISFCAGLGPIVVATLAAVASVFGSTSIVDFSVSVGAFSTVEVYIGSTAYFCSTTS